MAVHYASAETVRVPAGTTACDGELRVPELATGLVIFAHGSGSSRFSSRNRSVAGVLGEAGFGTLHLDLVSPDEAAHDDGTHTRLRFAKRGDFPALFVRNDDGSESLLNFSVDGGDIVVGEAHDRRMRLAAARYAGLFADHVAQDLETDAGPGAYALVWACARLAFIESFVPGIPPATSAALRA